VQLCSLIPGLSLHSYNAQIDPAVPQRLEIGPNGAPGTQPIMKRILSGVLRRNNVGRRKKSRTGAVRIEFIELSLDESMGME
jgi:hypothetical protein